MDGGIGISAAVAVGAKFIERSKFTARHDVILDKEVDKSMRLAERFDSIPREDVDHFEFQEYTMLRSRSLQDLRHYRNTQEEYKQKEWYKEPIEKFRSRGRVREAKRQVQSSSTQEGWHVEDLETYSLSNSSRCSSVTSSKSAAESGLNLDRNRPYRTDSCSIRATGGSPPSAGLEDISQDERNDRIVNQVSQWLSSVDGNISPPSVRSPGASPMRKPHEEEKGKNECLCDVDRKNICLHHLRHPNACWQEDLAHRFGVQCSIISEILEDKEKWPRLGYSHGPTRMDLSCIDELNDQDPETPLRRVETSQAKRRFRDSVSGVSDDRVATGTRRPPDEETRTPSSGKSSDSPLKSVLRLAPSAWQLYFIDWIQKQQASGTRKLNVAQAAKEVSQEYACLSTAEKEPYKRRSHAMKEAREKEHEAYMRSLSPEDNQRENLSRAAQCNAGKSCKGYLKDPHAHTEKPLSAYLMFFQRIRANPHLVLDVFGEETDTTNQRLRVY